MAAAKIELNPPSVCLTVADQTEEFPLALHYAARVAQMRNLHVGILHIIETEDFQHWETVESMIRKEMREGAEKFLWSCAKTLNDLTGEIPALYLAEGRKDEAVIRTIEGDPSITRLVLGAGTGARGPGPLVSHFTGKGLARLKVPVVIIPASLAPDMIDLIA